MNWTRPLLILFLSVPVATAIAQQGNPYLENLEVLYHALKKTPSYKDQIRGEKKIHFEQLYQELQLCRPSSSFDTLYSLGRLLFPLKDNHLFFYQLPPETVDEKLFKDSSWIQAYRQSDYFQHYPQCAVNIDSLEHSLRNKTQQTPEGIYYYKNLLVAGLYRTTEKSDSLVAVILESWLPHWDRGQLAFILKQESPGKFQAIVSNPVYKYFGLVKNELLINNTLAKTGWKKFPHKPDFSTIDESQALYQLSWKAPDIQYLRLGSFYTSTSSLEKSRAFYQSIKDSLHAPFLIVDLRNNTGGGFRSAQPFINLLRRYSRKGQIFLLINFHTVSNAEQVAIQLSKWKSVTVLGHHTNGTLTYGNNRGTVVNLPHGGYRLYTTDMRDKGNYLQYETIGLYPQVELKIDRDWLEQTLSYIRNQPALHSTTSALPNQ